MINRRKFGRLLGLSYLAGRSLIRTNSAQAQTAANVGQSRPFHIGMIIFDGMTTLDFAGPADLFSRPPSARVFVLAKSTEPVVSDTNGRILPDMAFKDAPELDMLFIGGGLGIAKTMEDDAIVGFLRERAPDARWITSVCTGALVLGTAGLLKGYKATTHWTCMDILPTLGAVPVADRVVIDRNRITGGGVTAGIDFGLVVASQLWGEETAQLLQLGSEYDPHPPFHAGSPNTAPQAVVDRFRRLSAKSVDERKAAALRMMAR